MSAFEAQLARDQARMIRRLNAVANLQSRRAKRRELRRLATSRTYFRAALWETAQRARFREHSYSPADIFMMAGEHSVSSAFSEAVHIGLKERKTGTLRRYFRLGILESARQRALLGAANTVFMPSPCQFAYSGGPKAIAKWLNDELPQAELVLTTDIPEFFWHIDRDVVEVGLPFPGWVTRRALFDPMDRAKQPKAKAGQLPSTGFVDLYPPTIGEVSPKGRGIPTGAALSQIASDQIVRDILLNIEDELGVKAAANGDNLIVLLPHASEESSVRNALTEMVVAKTSEAVSKGLTSRMVTVSSSDKIRYCGRTYQHAKGSLKVEISDDRIEAFALRFGVRLADMSGNDDEIQAARRSLEGWFRQNAFCPKATTVALELMAELTALYKSPY